MPAHDRGRPVLEADARGGVDIDGDEHRLVLVGPDGSHAERVRQSLLQRQQIDLAMRRGDRYPLHAVGRGAGIRVGREGDADDVDLYALHRIEWERIVGEKDLRTRLRTITSDTRVVLIAGCGNRGDGQGEAES